MYVITSLQKETNRYPGTTGFCVEKTPPTPGLTSSVLTEQFEGFLNVKERKSRERKKKSGENKNIWTIHALHIVF